ncbi:hypothetical protein PGB90_000242 [Kerria lacca]
MERFVGKVAVVTGASSGIGEAIAKELVKYKLVVVGLARSVNKLQAISEEVLKDSKTYRGQFHGLQCDISDEKNIKDTFQKIKSTIGLIHILVNNAGVATPNDRGFQMISGNDFDTIFNTNTKGLVLCAKEVLDVMVDNSIAGHIINIDTIASLSDFKVDSYHLYAASKHAVRALTTAMRREMTRRKTNIKISTISPGVVVTEATKEIGVGLAKPKEEALSVQDIVNACITILNTEPSVLITEMTVVPLYQYDMGGSN